MASASSRHYISEESDLQNLTTSISSRDVSTGTCSSGALKSQDCVRSIYICCCITEQDCVSLWPHLRILNPTILRSSYAHLLSNDSSKGLFRSGFGLLPGKDLVPLFFFKTTRYRLDSMRILPSVKTTRYDFQPSDHAKIRLAPQLDHTESGPADPKWVSQASHYFYWAMLIQRLAGHLCHLGHAAS
ncbi:hypothetical protein VNO77_01989 [Canavalia gladiata]|uniref:Uncharacterized protein n=1 Tax=Canavalia gladiata TaxID=3824 RepID=A0AAN9R5H5_CANGL